MMITLSTISHMTMNHQIEISDEVAFFKIHDLNHDGFWDERDLWYMYGFEGGFDSDSEYVKLIIHKAFEEMDKNGDRLISLDEYTNAKLPQINQKYQKAEEKVKRRQPVVPDDSPNTKVVKSSDEETKTRGTIPNKFRA